MITQGRAMQMIEDAIRGLRSAGILESDVTVTEGTVLLGLGSELDSVSFVTLISDLEDRLSRETGRDQFLILDDLHEFNSSAPSLTVRALAPYLVEISGRS